MYCKDTWKRHILPEKLKAYKLLIQAGKISDYHVVYNHKAGTTTVEYYSTIPHEWILEELKKAAVQPTCEQISMDNERR